MNLWSVMEKSSQRIVIEEKVGKSSNLISNILMFLLCCTPGFIALWFGIPNLPKTLSCKPDGKISQCQETRSFLNIPIETHSFVRQQQISAPIVRDFDGNNILMYGGLAYIGGIMGIVILYSSLVVSHRVWVFDRDRQLIINEKYTALRKTEQRYRNQDVFSVILEINDLIINATPDLIFVRLNLQSGAQPTQYQPFNPQQPIFYDCEYSQLNEAIDKVILPTSKLLQVPYQIKLFFQQQACSVFDFDRQYVDIFADRHSCQIPFIDIQGFKVEQISAPQRIVSISDEDSTDGNIYITYTYQLLLIAKDGACLPIHQVESRESTGRRDREQEMQSLTDNQSYRSMKILQQQLERLLTAVPI